MAGIRRAASSSDLVTIDRTAVNPKVKAGSAAAAFSAFVTAYVLQLLGHWSFFATQSSTTKEDAGAVILGVVAGIATYVVGHATSLDQAIAAEVTHVVGPEQAVLLGHEARALVADVVDEKLAGVAAASAAVPPPAPATVVVQAAAAPPTVVIPAPAVPAPEPTSTDSLDLSDATSA